MSHEWPSQHKPQEKDTFISAEVERVNQEDMSALLAHEMKNPNCVNSQGLESVTIPAKEVNL